MGQRRTDRRAPRLGTGGGRGGRGKGQTRGRGAPAAPTRDADEGPVTDEGGTHSGLQLMGQMMGRKPKPLQKRELCMRKLSRKKKESENWLKRGHWHVRRLRSRWGARGISLFTGQGVGQGSLSAAQQWIHAEAPLSLLGSSDLTRGREASAAPTRDAEGGRGRMGRNPRRGSNVERRGPGPLPGFNRTPNGSGNGSAGGFVTSSVCVCERVGGVGKSIVLTTRTLSPRFR